MQALSAVGRCKTFDSTADGYGRGEGFIAAVLERRHATEPRLHKNAILGSSVNHAGRSSGLTAPNGPAQAALISSALAGGGCTATDVRYLSLHGTGTPLGDPIELGALAQVLQSTSSAAATTLVSNKSCYGHTEGAAGLTGLLLASCVLHQATAPGVMHLRQMNPYVESALAGWARHGPRCSPMVPRQSSGACYPGAVAGSSSFGMSGVNAHMLLTQGSTGPDARPTALTIWSRQRAWPFPPLHTLLQRLGSNSKGSIFLVSLSRAGLSFLWDHQVSKGR